MTMSGKLKLIKKKEKNPKIYLFVSFIYLLLNKEKTLIKYNINAKTVLKMITIIQ